jgi:hypothetical protein
LKKETETYLWKYFDFYCGDRNSLSLSACFRQYQKETNDSSLISFLASLCVQSVETEEEYQSLQEKIYTKDLLDGIISQFVLLKS